MIKANEIRIGNAIWDDTAGKVRFVTHRIISDIASSAEPLPYSSIPITSEWLKKFGFDTMDYEYDVIEWAHPNTELKFSITQSGIPVEQQPFTFDYDQGMGGVEKEIKYIHQLQNLYHDLTSEELTIKELQP